MSLSKVNLYFTLQIDNVINSDLTLETDILLHFITQQNISNAFKTFFVIITILF